MKTLYAHVDSVRLRSPTGIWTAAVAEDTVEGALASEDTLGIYVTSKQHPKETDATELLWYEFDGANDDLPRIAWSAPNVLRVTVPNLSLPTILTLHLDGVTVDLRYDPDDPGARAKLLKQMNEELKAADQAK